MSSGESLACRARLVHPQRGQTMMPMRMRRKPRHLEKVEINCRTATAEHAMPARAGVAGNKPFWRQIL
jgi:hypothetical protein